MRGDAVPTVLFWIGWVVALLGGGYWRYPGSATWGYGADILIVLLIGLIGYHVFPFQL